MIRKWPGALLILFLVTTAPAGADNLEGRDTLFLRTSLYTKHFNPDPGHVNNQALVALEYNKLGGWLLGGAAFQNSFGQPTQYLYVGKKFVLSQVSDHLYGKLTGGLVHGYKGDHKDDIPFNDLGVAPIALPSLGLQFGRFGTELIVFGTAGMMVTVGWHFPLGKAPR